MLDIKFIREHPDRVRQSIERRGLTIDIEALLVLDKKRLAALQTTERLRAQLKVDSKPTDEQLTKLKTIRTEFEQAQTELDQCQREYDDLMLSLPNLLADDTPVGGEDANRIERQWGEKPSFDFTPRDHMALSDLHDLVNFEAGAKVAGNKFYFLRPRAVKLWQAILRLAQDKAEAVGYEIMLVPQLVNERVAAGTGYLPKGEAHDNYQDTEQGMVLIATSEIPLTGYHMDEILELDSPRQYAGLSTCYRLEGSAYGKFAKGLYRVHQFEKLELYLFTSPEQSDAELTKLLKLEEEIFQALEIPYQVSRTASGDLSAPAYKKYDLEYFSPVDDSYRELTSCSNCTDFQARRLNIRYRNADGKPTFVHTINGTAVNSTRSLIALLENHQRRDGSVSIPDALQSYYGKEVL